jgi:hypothetical protein
MGKSETSAHDTVPHEFIDVELEVEGLRSPTDEQKLTGALNGLDGIRSVALLNGKLTIEYEPVRVTEAELVEILARAGFRARQVESGAASAIGDAVRNPAPENPGGG